MFEYLGLCLPFSRDLLVLMVVGCVLGAAWHCLLWWLSGPTGEREARHLVSAALLATAPLVAVAVLALAVGDQRRSCPPIRDTLSPLSLQLLRKFTPDLAVQGLRWHSERAAASAMPDGPAPNLHGRASRSEAV